MLAFFVFALVVALINAFILVARLAWEDDFPGDLVIALFLIQMASFLLLGGFAVGNIYWVGRS